MAGMATADFGVGGGGQVALGAGGGVPVRAVGHDRGEGGLALPVGLVHGAVVGREFLLPGGGGADLAELITHLSRCPGRLDRVGVAQVQQPPDGHAAHVRTVDRAEGSQGFVPGGPQVRGGATGSGPIASAGSL